MEDKNVPVPVADYVPEHGGHSKEKKNVKAPLADYTPEHGGHAKPRHFKEEAKSEDYFNFVNHNPNSKIGRTHDDVHEKLNPSQQSWDKKPKLHRDAASEYTGASYWINRELVAKGHNKPSTFEHLDTDQGWEKKGKSDYAKKFPKAVKGLDSFLKGGKVKHDMTVFHGVSAKSSQSFNPGELASQHPDRHIRMPAYLSTSIHPSIASSFARPMFEGKPTTTHILRIHLKKGQSGYRYLGDRSEFPKEREGILARDKTLKISEHPTEIHHHETGGKMHVWDAHVID